MALCFFRICRCGSALSSPYFKGLDLHCARAHSRERVRTLLVGIAAALQLVVSLSLISLILLHAGKGGGMADMFGGGMSSGNVGGSTLVEKNLDRLTVIIAVLFVMTTLILTWLQAVA